MLDVTKLSLLIKNSQKHFSLELAFLINIWKILVPEIFLFIKDKGTFAFAKGITDNGNSGRLSNKTLLTRLSKMKE